VTATPGSPIHLGVVHVTEYRYPEPAWDSFNEVRLSPTDDHAQSLLSFELELSPEATVRSHLDYYGNRAHQFHIAEAHRRLAIEARSSVVTYPRPAPVEVAADSLAELKPRFFEFLAPTRRVPLEPMAEFVRARAGVCQDYTHVMLALCRRIGIPARYVSGYLETGAGLTLGSDASHAWIEAYLPGSGWVGFDPTNGTLVEQTYVKVGHGRDYDDVPPVKGLRRGGGTESLRVAVRVMRVEAPGTAAASTA